jgi:hypothetical protein
MMFTPVAYETSPAVLMTLQFGRRQFVVYSFYPTSRQLGATSLSKDITCRISEAMKINKLGLIPIKI